MAVNTNAIGKTYAPLTYAVGREKIREYAYAVEETNQVYADLEVARASGYRDLVAPPMFAVVYSGPALGPVLFDPEVEMNFAAMVHGAQAFEWGEPVCSGDTITTETTVEDLYERTGMEFFVFKSVSKNQDGDEVVRGTWTNIVRGG